MSNPESYYYRHHAKVPSAVRRYWLSALGSSCSSSGNIGRTVSDVIHDKTGSQGETSIVGEKVLKDEIAKYRSGLEVLSLGRDHLRLSSEQVEDSLRKIVKGRTSLRGEWRACHVAALKCAQIGDLKCDEYLRFLWVAGEFVTKYGGRGFDVGTGGSSGPKMGLFGWLRNVFISNREGDEDDDDDDDDDNDDNDDDGDDDVDDYNECEDDEGSEGLDANAGDFVAFPMDLLYKIVDTLKSPSAVRLSTSSALSSHRKCFKDYLHSKLVGFSEGESTAKDLRLKDVDCRVICHVMVVCGLARIVNDGAHVIIGRGGGKEDESGEEQGEAEEIMLEDCIHKCKVRQDELSLGMKKAASRVGAKSKIVLLYKKQMLNNQKMWENLVSILEGIKSAKSNAFTLKALTEARDFIKTFNETVAEERGRANGDVEGMGEFYEFHRNMQEQMQGFGVGVNDEEVEKECIDELEELQKGLDSLGVEDSKPTPATSSDVPAACVADEQKLEDLQRRLDKLGETRSAREIEKVERHDKVAEPMPS